MADGVLSKESAMPICPGCEQTIPYDRLDVHVRYCVGIWSAARYNAPSSDRLESQITTMEHHLDRRLRELESDIDRRLLDLEQQTRQRPRRPD